MIKKIMEIADVSRGASPRPIDGYLSTSGLPWLKISDVTIGKQFVYETKQYIKHSGLSTTKYMPKDTFVLTNSATPGIPFFLGKSMCLHDGFLYLENISTEIDKKYLFYWFLANRNSILNQGAGSIFTNLKADIVKNISINIPDLQIQHHIVNIMESVDNVIDSIKQNIKKVTNLLYGVLAQHFNNDSLESKPLEEIIQLKKGYQLNGDKLKNSGLYKMYNGGASYSGMTEDYNVNENTIIISEGGNSCGYVNFIKEKFWAGGHCYIVSLIKKTNIKYLYFALKYNQEQIMKLRVGSGLPNIQKKALYKFNLKMLFNIEEQDRYEEVFTSFENQINELKDKLNKYKNIRDGLSKGMFSGKINIPENYEEV